MWGETSTMDKMLTVAGSLLLTSSVAHSWLDAALVWIRWAVVYFTWANAAIIQALSVGGKLIRQTWLGERKQLPCTIFHARQQVVDLRLRYAFEFVGDWVLLAAPLEMLRFSVTVPLYRDETGRFPLWVCPVTPYKRNLNCGEFESSLFAGVNTQPNYLTAIGWENSWSSCSRQFQCFRP